MKHHPLIAFLAAAALFSGCTKTEEAADHRTAPTAPAPAEAPDSAAPPQPSAAPPQPSAAPAAHPAAAAAAPAGGPAAAAPAVAGPAPTGGEVEAAGTKLVAMFAKLGDAMAANAGDCAAMATAIRKVGADHKDFLQEAQKWQNNPAAQAEMTAWLTKNGAMAKTQEKMTEAMTKCGQDPAVMSAITEMMAPN
jgi:hypothetical protein